MQGEIGKSHISFTLLIAVAADLEEPEVIEGGNVSRARNSREGGTTQQM